MAGLACVIFFFKIYFISYVCTYAYDAYECGLAYAFVCTQKSENSPQESFSSTPVGSRDETYAARFV